MSGLTQDIRYALRAARRAPVFSAIAIACLAVGIGVNAAAFSVLDAPLVRDLPDVVAANDNESARGVEPEGTERVRISGRDATLVV